VLQRFVAPPACQQDEQQGAAGQPDRKMHYHAVPRMDIDDGIDDLIDIHKNTSSANKESKFNTWIGAFWFYRAVIGPAAREISKKKNPPF
jgi:hypothetical protein